ncbi:hypothetical protein ACLMAJ_22075 [Nocardia sp. KC 131]|uniref:hypothetical protein n=1 Tax=Nocardia arseniciresistens TaxID=3392119 RepID=UPI00398F6D0A
MRHGLRLERRAMRVLCVGSCGSDLPEEILRNFGYQPGNQFSVIVGVEYTVRAMGLWNSGLNVMVVSMHGWPKWYPIELFVVVDGELPSGWEFSVMDGKGPFVRALWGYPALIHDPDHFGGLAEREDSAREVFLRESGVTEWDEKTRKFIE